MFTFNNRTVKMKKVLRAKELAIKQEPFGGIIPPFPPEWGLSQFLLFTILTILIFHITVCEPLLGKTCCCNPLQPSVTYLYPLKTSENLKVFWCFSESKDKQHRAVIGSWDQLLHLTNNFNAIQQNKWRILIVELTCVKTSALLLGCSGNLVISE